MQNTHNHTPTLFPTPPPSISKQEILPRRLSHDETPRSSHPLPSISQLPALAQYIPSAQPNHPVPNHSDTALQTTPTDHAAFKHTDAAGGRRIYDRRTLSELYRIAIEINPWERSYGQKRQAYEEIHRELQRRGFALGASYATTYSKLNDSVKYKKNPDSTRQGVVTIGRALANNNWEVNTGALLERVEALHDRAQRKIDRQKERNQEKARQAQEGGDVLRAASMKASYHYRRRRRRLASPLLESDGEDGNGVIDELVSINEPPGFISEFDEEYTFPMRPSKRRCLVDRRLEESTDELLGVFRDYVEDSKQQTDGLLRIMRDLLELERERLCLLRNSQINI